MIALTKITARDFGEALKVAREETHATLESIAERTKISTRMLAALEAGEFGKLPSQVFARMFLRQYLDFIGAPPERWLQAFDVAWRRSTDSSQSISIRPAPPVRKPRTGPWLVGLALVGAGVVGVLLVENRQRSHRTPPVAAVAAPSPVGAQPRPPAAPTVAPTAAPEPTAPPGSLSIRTAGSACWVEVRVAGESAASRLMPAGAVWEIPAGGKDVDLVLGDAGAASVAYMGRTQSPAGRPGEVAHLHLAGATAAPVQR